MLVRASPTASGRPAPRPGAPATSPGVRGVPPVTRSAALARTAGLAGPCHAVARARARAPGVQLLRLHGRLEPAFRAGHGARDRTGAALTSCRAAGTIPQRVRAPSLTSGPGIGSLTACMQREPARAVEWEAQRGGEAARLHAGASGASVGRLEDAIFHPARPARPKSSSSSRMSRPRPRAAQSGELAVSARCALMREVGAARVFGVV